MTEKLYVISLEYEIRERELSTAQCNKSVRFVKLKVKVTLVKATMAQRGGGGQRNSFTLTLTPALDEGVGS